MLKVKYEMDLTEGPVYKQLLIFALPVLFTGVLQQLFNTADQIVAGKLVSDTALAAVGSTAEIFNLFTTLFIGLSTGLTVSCAKHKGADDSEGVKKSIGTGIILAFISGAILVLVGETLCRLMLDLISTPKEVYEYSELYMRIIFAGVPFHILYNFGAGILRANGDTRRPMYLLALGGVINVLLNVSLVLLLPEELGDKRVMGVAIGTVASNLFASIGVVIILIKSTGVFRLEKKYFHLYKEPVVEILKTGIPTGLGGIAYSIANIIIIKNINQFGKDALAGNTSANSIFVYIWHWMNAFKIAAISFAGQCFGAGKYKRISEATRKATLVTAIGVVVLGGAALLFSDQLLHLFISGDEALQYGRISLYVFAISYIIFVPTMILSGTLSGVERSTLTMVLNLALICGVRLIWIFVFVPLDPTFLMLFLSYPISWFFAGVAHLIAYVYVAKRFGKDKASLIKTE